MNLISKFILKFKKKTSKDFFILLINPSEQIFHFTVTFLLSCWLNCQAMSWINTFMPLSPKTKFHYIILMKPIFRKYLKNKCSFETNSQLSLKYISNFWLISQLYSFVSSVQTTLVNMISRHEWVKIESTSLALLLSDQSLMDGGPSWK